MWRRRPLLRRLYHDWYELVVTHLSTVPGKTVELGAGTAHFKDAFPAAVATDVEPTPWADEVVDAERLPYGDASLANLVLIDVFHHLAHPVRFFDECRRALAVGGRVVMLDPYCSLISTPARAPMRRSSKVRRSLPIRRGRRLSSSARPKHFGIAGRNFGSSAGAGSRWSSIPSLAATRDGSSSLPPSTVRLRSSSGHFTRSRRCSPSVAWSCSNGQKHSARRPEGRPRRFEWLLCYSDTGTGL